ncbi:MAG: ATP-binding protein, partial [Candidatus Thermoplasmatota archaeon]|nr:ATP-binding protein [Candidatus Thermoplasmatota archaeon]
TEINVSDLLNIYEFSGPQKEALGTAAHKLGKNWIVELHDTPADMLREGALKDFHEGTISVVQRRIQHIFRYDLVSRDPGISMTSSVIKAMEEAKVVLVDTSNMYETEELLVSTVLARAVFEHNKSLYAEPQRFNSLPSMLITMEEAQRVLDKSRGTIFAQIAREGRKFKTGLCAISQQPKLIDNQIISQFNTLMILGLADRRDREILRDSAKQDISKLDNEIQMLMQGEAIVASPFTPFAIPIKVHLYERHIEEIGKRGEMDGKRREKKAKPDDAFF